MCSWPAQVSRQLRSGPAQMLAPIAEATRPSTLAPPSIQSIAGSYTLQVVKSPEFVITRNERVYDELYVRSETGIGAERALTH